MKARLPQGMGGSRADMMANIQKMQQDMENTQEALKAKEYTATSGGGMVRATVNGEHKVLNLSINPDVVDADDVDILQDMIIAAINEATLNAIKDSEEEMGKISPGIDLSALGL